MDAFNENDASTNEDILHHTPENLIPNEIESEMRIISLTQYNNLMQLVPKVAKFEVTIRALAEKLKAKDELISQMKKDFQRELKDRDRKLFLDSLDLTTVSNFS